MSEFKRITNLIKDLGVGGTEQTASIDNPINIALSKFADGLIADLKESLQSKGSNVSRVLSQSIRFTPITVQGDVIETTLVMEDYGKFVDKGVSGTGIDLKDGDAMRETSSIFKFKFNRPSRKHIFGTDGNGLRDWVNAKGGDMSLAYAIGTQNKKLGIKGNKFFSDVFTPEKKAAFIKEIEKQIAKKLKLNGNSGN